MRNLLTAILIALFAVPSTAYAVELPSEGDAFIFQGYLCKTEEARDNILNTYSEVGQMEAAQVQRAYLKKGTCGTAKGRAILAEIGDPQRSADGKYKLIAVTLQTSPTSTPYYTFLRLPSNEKSA